MKTLAYLAWFAGAAALAAAQNNRTSNTSAAEQAALRAIDRGHEAFLAAMRANDAGALAKLLAPDAVFYPPNSAPLVGPEAVRIWFQSVVDKVRTTGISVTDRRVALGGDRAIEEGEFVWSVASTGGGAPIEDRGRFMAIYQRQPDGGWKVARDIWNSSLPSVSPPATSTAANDPWMDGTWELNVARSKFNPGPGPRSETRTYSMTPDGRQHAIYDLVDADGKRVRSESTFTLDGKDSLISGDLYEDTQAVMRTGPRSVSAVIKKGGKVVRTATREASEDGQMLTLRFKGVNAKGQPLDDVWVFERKSDEVVAAVKAAVENHWNLINRGEFDAVARQHTLNMSMFMPEFDTRVVLNSPLGLAAMRRLDGAKPRWTPRDIQVQVLGGSAVASYYMDGSTRWPDGTIDSRPRRVTEVWVNENGVWKEAHHHDSVYIANMKLAATP